MRLMVAGTVLAAALAVERGWAINMGGGMHHAYFEVAPSTIIVSSCLHAYESE